MTNRRSTRRILLGATALAGALALSAATASAQERRYDFDVPAQPLNAALQAFARQAQLQVIFAEVETKDLRAPPLNGSYSADEALEALLAGTELKVSRTNKGVFQIAANPDPQSSGAAGGGAEVEALIVTAQKREEDIQDVPIAISAFTQDSLDAQKLEGGFDLLKAIPNVTFSKNNFTSYNFSIRGIGTKAISATTDPGVAVSFNNTTLIVNRLFEQEYFDVERVEVLRGPQGTLYGRNATSGVINVLSARPRMGEFEGDIKLEVGNYSARRARGMLNVPIGDTLAVRFAGALTKRDGYGYNEFDGSDVDDRDLWSFRTTVGWEPTEAVRVNLLWEHFEEDDERVRTSKQLCHRDEGPNPVGDWNWDEDVLPSQYGADFYRALTSTGCKAGSLYEDGAYGTPNGSALPYITGSFFATIYGQLAPNPDAFPMPWGYFGVGFNPKSGLPDARCVAEYYALFQFPLDVCELDPYAGRTQSRDIRSIYSQITPIYRAKADIYELSFDVDIGEDLTFTSQTVYNRDEVYASQDYNRFTTDPIFSDSLLACQYPQRYADENTGDVYDFGFPCNPGQYLNGLYANLLPGGVFTDPQLGPSNTLLAQDLSKAESEQFTQEVRLASDFDSRINFSVGANYTKFETLNDYYVFANVLTMMTYFYPFNLPTGCAIGGGDVNCIYVDPNPLESVDGEGRNYFRSSNPYELESTGLFGELYWQATDTVKLTAGLRMTWDQKVFTPVPSKLLLAPYEGDNPASCTSDPCFMLGNGAPGDDIVQEWSEPTGRLVVDWKPDLALTDDSMFYASYAHGYKGGGANPPGIAPPSGLLIASFTGGVVPETFLPEFIDAFELGTKNTLLDGALIFNATTFYYAYEEYQVSKIFNRSANNENFDARIWGTEFEWILSPSPNLRFNGTFGTLRSEIAEGERSIDLMDRTQGGHVSFTTPLGHTFDEWMTMKPFVTNPSNCVAPVDVVEYLLFQGIGDIDKMCPSGNVIGTSYNVTLPDGRVYRPRLDGPNASAGFFDDLSGNELPNAPHWTASLGAQYRMGLPSGWDATLRGDFYWQSQSFARVYNTQYDKLRAWTNANVSLWFEHADLGITAEVYVKNVFDEEPITDAFLNSDDSGLTTNVFTLDPRLIGMSIRKKF